VDQAERLGVAPARVPLAAAVVEAQPLVVAAGRGDQHEGVRVDGRAGARQRQRDRLQRLDAVAQP
jgi:hypothetical protein